MSGNETRLRLAAARRTEAQLRELVSILLSQGEGVFASRSWRIGSALTGLAARCRAWFGTRPVAPQSAAHWREIVDAHYDRLQRERVLLEQLCVDPSRVQDPDVALTNLWNNAGDERVLRGAS